MAILINRLQIIMATEKQKVRLNCGTKETLDSQEHNKPFKGIRSDHNLDAVKQTMRADFNEVHLQDLPLSGKLPKR